jgi:hypothetical protein
MTFRVSGRRAVRSSLGRFFLVAALLTVGARVTLVGAPPLRPDGQVVEVLEGVGQAREGDTGARPPGGVEGWKAGDPATVRFDRAPPQDSVGVGRA